MKSDLSGISVDEGLEDTRLLPTIRGAGPKNFFRSPYLIQLLQAEISRREDALPKRPALSWVEALQLPF